MMDLNGEGPGLVVLWIRSGLMLMFPQNQDPSVTLVFGLKQGADRGKRDSGGYISGSSSFSKEVRAEDYVYMGGDYTYHSAYINSQDDEDW